MTDRQEEGPVLDLAGIRQDAREARGFLGQVLPGLGWEGRVDDASLLVSELLANVVLHARTACQVAVISEPGRLEISVHDDSPVLPRPRNYSADAATGRGLRLLGALADSWGVDPDGDGKRIWFRFEASAAADPGDKDLSRIMTPETDPADLDAILARLGGEAEGSDTPVSRSVQELVCA